jgi:hypothetical protein
LIPVALTALKVQVLGEKEFDQLFTNHRDLWKTKASEAHQYTAKFVIPTGQPVRPDDVLPLLMPALELAPEFHGHLGQKHLTQKYWTTYFAEFVLDRLWEELTNEEEEADDGERDQ